VKWSLLPSGCLAAEGSGLPPEIVDAGVVMVMPCTNAAQAQRAAAHMAQRAGVDDAWVLALLDEQGEGFVEMANRAFRATRSPYFGYTAQDAYAGRHWLQLALGTLQQSGRGLLAFNDGKWAGALAAFGLGARTWLQQHYGGDLFCPHYSQHYADTELSVLALGNGQMAYNPNAVLMEVDWDKDGKGVNPLDRVLFANRKGDWLKGQVAQPQALEMFR
jgi:hypothetical protein